MKCLTSPCHRYTAAAATSSVTRAVGKTSSHFMSAALLRLDLVDVLENVVHESVLLLLREEQRAGVDLFGHDALGLFGGARLHADAQGRTAAEVDEVVLRLHLPVVVRDPLAHLVAQPELGEPVERVDEGLDPVGPLPAVGDFDRLDAVEAVLVVSDRLPHPVAEVLDEEVLLVLAGTLAVLGHRRVQPVLRRLSGGEEGRRAHDVLRNAGLVLLVPDHLIHDFHQLFSFLITISPSSGFTPSSTAFMRCTPATATRPVRSRRRSRGCALRPPRISSGCSRGTACT